MKKIITLLVGIVTLCVTAQDSVLLRLKYEVGSAYLTKMKMIQDMPNMKNNTAMDMKTKIISFKDGVVETENSFDKIVVDAEGQGQVIKYSSEKKESDMSPTEKMVHAQMKGLKDAVVLLYFNERGKMKDAKIKSGNKTYLQAFKESSPVEFPEEAVKVGSTWKQTVSKNGMEISSIYTVKTISEKEVVVAVVGSISGQAKGEASGIMTIDVKTGHTIKSNMNNTISMGGMDMEMKVNLTSSKI